MLKSKNNNKGMKDYINLFTFFAFEIKNLDDSSKKEIQNLWKQNPISLINLFVSNFSTRYIFQQGILIFNLNVRSRAEMTNGTETQIIK